MGFQETCFYLHGGWRKPSAELPSNEASQMAVLTCVGVRSPDYTVCEERAAGWIDGVTNGVCVLCVYG